MSEGHLFLPELDQRNFTIMDLCLVHPSMETSLDKCQMCGRAFEERDKAPKLVKLYLSDREILLLYFCSEQCKGIFTNIHKTMGIFSKKMANRFSGLKVTS